MEGGGSGTWLGWPWCINTPFLHHRSISLSILSSSSSISRKYKYHSRCRWVSTKHVVHIDRTSCGHTNGRTRIHFSRAWGKSPKLGEKEEKFIQPTNPPRLPWPGTRFVWPWRLNIPVTHHHSLSISIISSSNISSMRRPKSHIRCRGLATYKKVWGIKHLSSN